jgi:signal transduction histidine kinase
MKHLLPDRISGQLIALMIGTVLLANLLSGFLFFAMQDRSTSHNPAETTGRIAALIELLDKTPQAERPALLVTLRAAHPDFGLAQATPGAQTPPASEKPRHLARALGARFHVTTREDQSTSPAPREHLVRLSDGTFVSAREPPPQDMPFPGPRLLSSLFVTLSLLAILIWSSRKITRPLGAIMRAAERYRPEITPAPLPETGPREIRALARAFNAMQQRIGELLTEKTNALAAVSHDLRTPITRMRLRAEFLPDTGERTRMIHDLDQMDQLTQSALDHLRQVARGTDRETIDLASLLHTIADRFSDEGHAVEVVAAPRLVARLRPLDLERALTNLVENACKYATPPTLRLYERAGMAVIEVEDRGAGIPATRREELMQPFTRGDNARGMNEAGGFGLGLAIAREAALRQGGALALLDALPQGLLVRITLPLAA